MSTSTPKDKGKNFLLPGARRHYAPNLMIVPSHIDVHVEVDFLKKRCQCEVEKVFKCNAHPKTQKIELNAVGFLNLMITSGSDHVINHRYDGEVIYLHWEEQFEPHEERSVKFSYTILEPIDGLFFSTPDEGYPNRPTYVIADHETERARYWLPCVDYPAIRTTFDFYFTFREDYVCVANGKLVNEQVNAKGQKTSHWKLEYPCPSYLCAFAVGELEFVPHGEVEGMPIAYLGVKGTPQELLLDCFGKTPDMVRWLTKRLGTPFPFRNIKYYQIAVPMIAGAMECISLVTWHDRFLFDQRLGQEMRLLLDMINIHEMAHSYFGDALVIRHFEHAWLKESWATYIEAIWIQEHLGEDHFRFEMEAQADMYISETSRKYVRPIVTREYNSSWNMFDQHLYPGGSWRLHMLRKIMSDDVFWAAVSDYINQFSMDLVETADFRRCLEEISGLNLHKFFDQWIYGRGYPKLKGEYVFDMEKREVKIVLEQVQPDDWTIFDMEIDVELSCDHDVVLTSKVAFEGQKRASTTLRLESNSKKPTMLRIDPHNLYLFTLEMNPGEDILGETLVHATDINNRIWAGNELIRIGSYSSYLKLEEAMLEEPFFGVRVKIAEKLGDTNSILAMRLLSKLVLREKDPMALQHLVGACHTRDKVLRESLLTVLEREELPYLAHANALLCIGKQCDPHDLPLLLDAAKSDYIGFHGFVRSGAYRGLAEIRSPEAYSFLKERVGYGVENEELRPTLTVSLGRCASMLDRRTQLECADILSDLLRDPDWRVRNSAVEALVILEAKHKVSDVSDLSASLAKQHHPWLERKISSLKASGDESNAIKLKIELDNLETKLKLLQERIRILESK